MQDNQSVSQNQVKRFIQGTSQKAIASCGPGVPGKGRREQLRGRLFSILFVGGEVLKGRIFDIMKRRPRGRSWRIGTLCRPVFGSGGKALHEFPDYPRKDQPEKKTDHTGLSGEGNRIVVFHRRLVRPEYFSQKILEVILVVDEIDLRGVDNEQRRILVTEKEVVVCFVQIADVLL